MVNTVHNRYFPGGITVNPLENFNQERVVKLHNAVSAQELGTGAYEGKRINVSSSTMEHLQLAQETLRKVKMMLPYGAGNQKVEMIYTGGESSARALMHREKSSQDAPIPNSRQAARYQAGNCEETSDLSYALLAQKRINAPVLLVGDSDWDHKYVLIGDPRDQNWGERNTVVVDPWARYPSAATLDQTIRRNPYPGAEYQRARNADPLPGAQALNSIRHVTTAEVAHYLAEENLPSIGADFLEWFSQSDVTADMFDEKTVARDPSTRYSTHMFNAKSMDDIAQPTVSRQRAAQHAWDNSAYRW
ncbi:type III effector [Brenneria roseae subsp. americana]|uniref:Type III effector n=1 Tax=Brenneria roseae subsp. americana TaxID=1508507 RepID=A0A2U1U027_9GAMM|nr:type III effector [Brenneria roseae]PWC15009.1 type III effector [Brenneria roseae subsp. americana]